MRNFTACLLGAVAAAYVGAAAADNLIIGVAKETSSVDPHWHTLPPNYQIADHMFDPLVMKDYRQIHVPALAESWKPVDDKVWEFKLRKGVKFHDGTPFTADDVLFTHKRATENKFQGADPGRYQRNKTITKVDDYTVHITTGTPYAAMVAEMSVVPIISKKNGQGLNTPDYNAGKGVIGTGPYKFVEWISGDRLVMVRNDDYWGGYWGYPQEWDKVTFKPIKSDPSRVAALLSGDVDFIDYVSTTDIAALRKNPKVAISESPSYRAIFLHVDSAREVSPHVKDNQGKLLIPNPLRDWRVRKAISKAIDRPAIVDRVMEGSAVAAAQILTTFNPGASPDLKLEAHDPDGAKKLLAQAGYPDGFRLTVHATNDRYVNDAKIIETIASMLTRIGIRTEVVTMPRNIYFTQARKGDPEGLSAFSLFLYGSGSDTGDGLTQFQGGHTCQNREANLGNVNRGRYCNSRVDVRIRKAQVTLEEKARNKLVQEAAKIATDDLGYIPLHYQKNVWAHRPDLVYQGRTDERTHAMGVRKRK